MLHADLPLAIPLWINGRPYLTMAPRFLDVRNPASGEVLRRTPLCGPVEALEAVEAARAALVQWSAKGAAKRAALLADLGAALSGFASHFARLITEETGKNSESAAEEVAAAVTLLCGADSDLAVPIGILGIVGDSTEPLLGSLRLAVPALIAGGVIVARPSPETPSVLFALAELAGRCGFPAGVFNILHGQEEAIDGLHAIDGVNLLFSMASPSTFDSRRTK